MSYSGHLGFEDLERLRGCVGGEGMSNLHLIVIYAFEMTLLIRSLKDRVGREGEKVGLEGRQRVIEG